MKQVLEIHHDGVAIIRIKLDGAIKSVEVEAEGVGIIGRPDLVATMPDDGTIKLNHLMT